MKAGSFIWGHIELRNDADRSIEMRHKGSRLTSFAKQVLAVVRDSLTTNSSIKIRQKLDHDGYPYWTVYDPMREVSARLYSESEVREWLEQRYYQ